MPAPSYTTNDPRGWCGNPRRGAALGRRTIEGDRATDARIYLRKIPIDEGGYDPNGTYFGAGQPLYWACTEDNAVDFVFRAASRQAALEHVRALYPNAAGLQR